MSKSSLHALRAHYDAVLLDMDGTLLDEASALTDRAVRAVHALREAGLRVHLCTGRSPPGTLEAYAALELDNEVVAYNGSWIGHPHADEPEVRIAMETEAVEHLRRVEMHALFGYRQGDRKKWTVPSAYEEHRVLDGWYSDVEHVEHPDALPDDDLLRLSLFFDRDVDVEGRPSHEHAWDQLPLQAHSALRLESFPLSFFPNFRASRLQFLEIQAASQGKAEAVAWLGRSHGIPAERVIAVGDHHNDIPMLEAAGLAVAMRNGIDLARERADLVIGSNDDEGLATWIEQGAPGAAEAATRRA